ncbi:MAG: hypothetical protein WCJ11_08480 [Methylococcaceae bacterium]
MKTDTKRNIRLALSILVSGNTFIFLVLAYLGMISNNPKTLVFIDFWGRLTVYSFWFVCYALYRKYLIDQILLKRIVIFTVCTNIPVFLLMGYLDVFEINPHSAVFIDFWGRLTVYSLWFMAYELYREYLTE